MPSVDLILEFRLSVFSKEYWALYLVSGPFACFHLKSKFDEVGPKYGKHLVACQPLLEVGSPDYVGMVSRTAQLNPPRILAGSVCVEMLKSELPSCPFWDQMLDL